LQGNEIEKKLDTISTFSKNKNIEFINNIKNYQGPLTVNTIKSLENIDNLKAEKILIEDTHLISGYDPAEYDSKNEIENIFNSIKNRKLESLNLACNKYPKVKDFLVSSPNENYSYNINAVLNMHCSEKFLKDVEYVLNKKIKNEYPTFFLDGKSIISVTISKVDASHITYLEAAPILESLLLL